MTVLVSFKANKNQTWIKLYILWLIYLICNQDLFTFLQGLRRLWRRVILSACSRFWCGCSECVTILSWWLPERPAALTSVLLFSTTSHRWFWKLSGVSQARCKECPQKKSKLFSNWQKWIPYHILMNVITVQYLCFEDVNNLFPRSSMYDPPHPKKKNCQWLFHFYSSCVFLFIYLFVSCCCSVFFMGKWWMCWN